MPQAAAITPAFWFVCCYFGGGDFSFSGTKKRQEGKKRKEKKSKFEVLDTFAHVCAYAPLFLISTLCAFLASGVVIPNSTSLPPEISSDSSQLSPAAAGPRCASSKTWAPGRGCLWPDRAPPAWPHSPESQQPPPDDSWQLSHPSAVPTHSLAGQNEPGRNKLLRALQGSCEPHTMALSHSSQYAAVGGSTPNQQMPYRSSKPQGAFQTLPTPLPQGEGVPSCELRLLSSSRGWIPGSSAHTQPRNFLCISRFLHFEALTHTLNSRSCIIHITYHTQPVLPLQTPDA